MRYINLHLHYIYIYIGLKNLVLFTSMNAAARFGYVVRENCRKCDRSIRQRTTIKMKTLEHLVLPDVVTRQLG